MESDVNLYKGVGKMFVKLIPAYGSDSYWEQVLDGSSNDHGTGTQGPGKGAI